MNGGRRRAKEARGAHATGEAQADRQRTQAPGDKQVGTCRAPGGVGCRSVPGILVGVDCIRKYGRQAACGYEYTQNSQTTADNVVLLGGRSLYRTGLGPSLV
jgi:hypothetical protein